VDAEQSPHRIFATNAFGKCHNATACEGADDLSVSAAIWSGSYGAGIAKRREEAQRTADLRSSGMPTKKKSPGKRELIEPHKGGSA
jgi:hypothetical protein